MTGEQILLIEDAKELRQFLADDILRPAGYDVLTAATGNEGYILARDLRPELIVADYQLPDRNALTILHELQQNNIDVPLILMTAEGSEALAVEALRLGVKDYLIKPFDPNLLIQAIERVISQYWTRQITEQVPAQLLQTNRRLEERLRELNTLVTIGKRVTGQLDLQEVLTQVTTAAVQLAETETGTLFLVDQASGELYLYAASEQFNPEATPSSLTISDSLAGQVVQTREPLVITGRNRQKIATQYFFHDLMYVPLITKDEVVGVLGVLNHETSEGFPPHALQLINVLADFAAIAIENARLYTATEHERDTLNTILRDTEDPIIVADQENHVLFCNPAARRVFELGPTECEEQPIPDAIHNTQIVELFDKEVRSGTSRRSEIVLNNGERVLNAQLTVVKGVGRVVVMQDITHLKELDRIKSEFVTSVSHDLRSPLTAILGYVEMVQRSGPIAEAQQTYMERIIFSVHSITALITDLLELGKIEAGFDQDREPVYLHKLVNHAVETARHQWEKKQQDMNVLLAPGGAAVLGNPLRLRQMIANLVENAVKYTPEQGRVEIALENDGEFLILRVSDTGIGIPPQDQPYIFDKFYRTDEAIDHYEGTGLGLSIVKSIVEGHGGRIWVDSNEGQGTVFTVMLAKYDPDAPRG